MGRPLPLRNPLLRHGTYIPFDGPWWLCESGARGRTSSLPGLLGAGATDVAYSDMVAMRPSESAVAGVK